MGADLGGVGVGGGGASVPAPRLARRPSQPRLVEVALSVLVGLPVPNEVVFDVPVGINRGSGGGAQPAARGPRSLRRPRRRTAGSLSRRSASWTLRSPCMSRRHSAGSSSRRSACAGRDGAGRPGWALRWSRWRSAGSSLRRSASRWQRQHKLKVVDCYLLSSPSSPSSPSHSSPPSPFSLPT